MIVPFPIMMQSALFAGSNLVAGSTGIDRLVTCINIIDGPFGYRYSRPGMLVLCSAYSIEGSTEKQLELLEQLYRRGVAAVALKPMHFSDHQIPKELCRRADELGFPLIALSDDCPSYAEFITFFSNSVYLRGTKEILYKDDLLKLLVQEMSQGGIPGLVKKISMILMRSVSILFEDECYAFPQNEETVQFDRALSSSSSARHFFPSPQFPELLYFREKGSRDDSDGTDNLGVELKVGTNTLNYMWLHGGDTPCNCDDASVIDSAVLACELEMVQVLSYQQQQARRRLLFVENLLGGKLQTLHEVLLMSKGLSWRLPLEMQVLIISCIDGVVNSQEVELALCEHFRAEKKAVVVFPYQDNLTVFLPAGGEEETIACQELMDVLAHQFDTTGIYFGVGRKVCLKEAHSSYDQACYALQIGRPVYPERHILQFEELGMFRLYCPTALPSELHLFCNDYVMPLIQVDSHTKLDLLKTLKTFFDCQQNYSRAGNALYLHPNTIRYRIETIEKICNMDFNDPDDVLNMKIALKLLPVIEQGNALL